MKTLLHITISEPLPATAQAIIDAEKKGATAQVEVVQLTPANAPAVLEKIFAADSICVWQG